jgi:hypothetical protein
MGLFGKASPDKFAKMVTRRARRRGCDGPMKYDRDEFALNSDYGTWFLSNMYAEYYAAPFLQRNRVLDTFITSVLETAADMPSSLDDARANLLPKVRERVFHESWNLHSLLKENSPPKIQYQVVAEHMAVDVVYDTPSSVRTVSLEDFEQWGVTFEEALAIGRDNLWNISKEPFGKLAPGTYVSTWQDTHDATRMFLHDLVWQLDVKGSHVAMVPDRNVLLVTGSEDAEGLLRMAEEAQQVLDESPRPLCGLAFILNGSAWEPYLPPDDAPSYGKLSLLACQYMASACNEQKSRLEDIYERDGTDIYVATYDAVQNSNTGRVLSYCTWARDAESLLPVTDLVGLFDSDLPKDDQYLGFASWSQVASIVGAAMELCSEMYPPRYRVREFLSPEQLAQIEFVEA